MLKCQMGLACIRKPEGLVLHEGFQSVIQKRRDSQVRSTGTTHKCDQQVRLTSVINRCDLQVRSTGATHKCDRLNHESESLQVCRFASLQV